MDRKEMGFEEFREMLAVRLREVRAADPAQQEVLARRAWEMVCRDVPWSVIVAAIRAAAGPGVEGLTPADGMPLTVESQSIRSRDESRAAAPPIIREESARRSVDQQDLARETPPPLRHEVGRYEREQLSANTRQAIRMARHARRWHEIRKMRNVLLNIDQAYLKRMLGSESDTLNQEINALLRSWAPLVRDRQQHGRTARRRR